MGNRASRVVVPEALVLADWAVRAERWMGNGAVARGDRSLHLIVLVEATTGPLRAPIPGATIPFILRRDLHRHFISTRIVYR